MNQFKEGDKVIYVGNNEGKFVKESMIGKRYTVSRQDDDQVYVVENSNHVPYAHNLRLVDVLPKDMFEL